MGASFLGQVLRRDKGRCHYCHFKVNKVPGHARQATREHILPKAFGGKNTLDNFVLACQSCNNKRATSLFYCRCDICSAVIGKSLSDAEVVNFMFEGIIAHNRPVVSKRGGAWQAKKGHVLRFFKTFDEAINYANNGTFMRGK